MSTTKTDAGLRDELAQLRAELDGLRPKGPVGPQPSGFAVPVKFAVTCWLAADRSRVVGDGDPEAGSLLGRAGLTSYVDGGVVHWLEAQGVALERLR